VGDRRALPVGGARLAPKGHAHKAGDHQLSAHPGTVRDAVAQHGKLLIVEIAVVVSNELSGDLRRRVNVAGAREVKGRLFVEQTLATGARVDPYGAGQHGPFDAL